MRVALVDLSLLSDDLYHKDKMLLKWENCNFQCKQLCETMSVDYS